MTTPYTTSTGVQIGLLYTPPAPLIQGDMLRLQSALLAKRYSTPLWLRLIWRWL
jgi:hypothetical protein